MKSILLVFALLFSISGFADPTGSPRRAAAETCVLCDDLIKYLVEIKEMVEPDEVKRQSKVDEIVLKAVDSLKTRLKSVGKSKLSAKEIDMIFKFEAEGDEADNLHQLMEMIYPLYKANKKPFVERIERSPYKAKIKRYFKDLENLEKNGNG